MAIQTNPVDVVVVFEDGWYIFTEASSAQRGDQTILRSKAVSAKIQICFTFFYLMYGKSMGKLEVFTSPLSSDR